MALFDFDGTLSLIRSGWVDVMVPMMVEILLDLKTGETEAELRAIVEEFVWRLTGKETIYQMMEFADHVTRRGGNALDPLEYKKMYLDLLWVKISGRVEDLQNGRASPEQYLVPGARALLERSEERGLEMYLASGTDEIYMKEEARLLDVARYFDGGVYGALDDYKSFSKKILIQRILSQTDVRGREIIGFGDGYRRDRRSEAGGRRAVGVATTEPECRVVDDWKRQRLIGVGADYIVPNFLGHARTGRAPCFARLAVNTLAIDIGGTKFTLALFEDETMVARVTRSTDREGGPEWMLRQIGRRSRANGSSTVAAWASAVRWISPRSAWRSRRTSAAGPIFRLAERLEAAAGVPVIIDNDANVGALGEARYGAGRGHSAAVLHDAFDRHRRRHRARGRQRISRRGFLGGRNRPHHLASRWPRVPVRRARLLRAHVLRAVAGARSRQAGARAAAR